MAIKAWEEVAAEPFGFPIRGKFYTVPEISYTDWLLIQKIQAGEVTEIEGLDADDTWKVVLGSAWDEMVADNVPAEALQRAGLAALTYVQFGRELAESVWEAGLDPKSVAAAVLARQKEAESTSSPSTASASPTRSQGSTKRMTSRKKSPASMKGSRSQS